MKSMIITLFFVFFITISCAVINLANVNFNSGSFPTGWTRTGTSANWLMSNTANAGGTAYELKFANSPVTAGVRRFISPAYNTTGYFELQLQFRQYLIDNVPSSNEYTIGVQVSNDLSNWSDIWYITGTDSYGPELTTLPIPSEYLNSTTFHVAFYFSGTPSDLVGWYIDSVVLDATKKAASGTWTAAANPHYLDMDYGVPVGQSLIIQPGVQVIAQGQYGLEVSGSIRAVGTAADSIRFTAQNHTTGWKGVNVYTASIDSVLFKYCILEWGNKPGSYGGVLTISYTAQSVLVQNCRFSDNVSEQGAALFCSSPFNVTVDRCLMKNNTATQKSTLILTSAGILTLSNSLIVNNISLVSSNSSHVYMQTNNATCDLVFESNTIANNTGADNACEIVGVSSMGMYFDTITFNNSIFWNDDSTYEISFINAMTSGNPHINYSDVRNQLISGMSPILNSSIFTNPLFASTASFGLSGNSPCLDAGNPALTDPDGSRKDIGAVPLWKKPALLSVTDVPFDQGLKVKVKWSSSQADGGGVAGGWYSVFRVDNSRNSNGMMIDSPLQLNNLTISDNVYWHYRDTDYLFIGDVPAYNFSTYSLNCATLQDSSSTGTHPVSFVVVYRNGTWFAVSDPMSGYSVDNIAPDAVRNLAITKESSQIRLAWAAVTTGTFNGNSYPEQHGVTYKIYCSDNADFEIGPATYLTTTTGTYNLVSILSSLQKFYRIVVSD